jgi:hypothetical protein
MAERAQIDALMEQISARMGGGANRHPAVATHFSGAKLLIFFRLTTATALKSFPGFVDESAPARREN